MASISAAREADAPPMAFGDLGDRAAVARLDLAYQAAVKHHDADAIDAILHADFAMVLGDGRVVSRDEIIAEARARRVVFERQDEDEGTQTVRVWDGTAVVTARLWIKGVGEAGPFERRLWFSDTYVRERGAWKYAFAQVSLPI